MTPTGRPQKRRVAHSAAFLLPLDFGKNLLSSATVIDSSSTTFTLVEIQIVHNYFLGITRKKKPQHLRFSPPQYGTVAYTA